MLESEELLKDLTPPQREAVLCTEGPLLVLAGPGSGKTRVITRRIAHLVSMGVPAWQILAVTFTNKAAGEMRHRVASILGDGPAARGLTVTTFHSLCVRMLRRYADLWTADRGGTPILKADFTVYDSDDQMSLMKKILGELDLSSSNWPPRSVLSAVSNAKNDLLDSRDFARTAGDFHSRTIAKAFEKYDAALRAAGAADFDDLLLLTAKMLRESSAVRAEVQRRYRYLLVDEYQDTNKSQFVIASLIAGEDHGAATPVGAKPNICVVGDPDQSIYGWRGADIANILQFEEHYPSAKVIALGENFRSLAPILHAADRLIRNNKKRKHKPLIAMRTGGSSPSNPDRQRKAGGGGGGNSGQVEITLCRDEHHEAALVLDWLKLRHESGQIEWKDAAVFYRTNALSRVMEDTLRNAGIPYTIVRGTAFFQREEVKNALAYLRILANPADSVSLARIINTPPRGIGDTTWQKLEAAAAERGIPVLQSLREGRSGAAGPLGVTARSSAAVGKFMVMLDSWMPREESGQDADSMFSGASAAEAAEGSLAELVERVVRESGLEQMYAKEEERNENLAELVSSAREFEAGYLAAAENDAENADLPGGDPGARGPKTLIDVLHAYLERVALVADTDALDPSQGAVTMMTLHAAKGLEYKAVALIGLEETILPHMRSNESEAALEEERRLCFVGVTRAMDRLLLTSAKYRTLRGLAERMIPSRFIDELRGDGVAISDQSGGLDSFEDDPDMRSFLAPRGGGFGGGGGGGGGGRQAGGASGPREHTYVPDDGPGTGSKFSVGSVVRHPQFGLGKIEGVTSGADARVRVKFNDVGTKTLVLAYARLERVK